MSEPTQQQQKSAPITSARGNAPDRRARGRVRETNGYWARGHVRYRPVDDQTPAGEKSRAVKTVPPHTRITDLRPEEVDGLLALKMIAEAFNDEETDPEAPKRSTSFIPAGSEAPVAAPTR